MNTYGYYNTPSYNYGQVGAAAGTAAADTSADSSADSASAVPVPSAVE